MLLNSGAKAGTTIIQDNFYQMDNIEKAKNRLIHFIKEMSAWEIACEEIDEQDIEEIEKLRQQKELLTDIFRKHCTAKKRVYGRPNTISYGSDYDPEEEKITQVSEGKDKIEITTQREKPMKEVFIYTLVRKGDEWFLVSKRSYCNQPKPTYLVMTEVYESYK